MHEHIEKIVVHAPDKSGCHLNQQNDIHYRLVIIVANTVTDSMKYYKKREAI